MKLTEAEAITKLNHIGLPTHGTYDELIERLQRNGLLVVEEAPKRQVLDEDEVHESLKKRGRPSKQ